ncbi:aminotransferase class IV [Caulobacter vibrioides]|uniref:Probable branched-chain-amino-acid aminotransferase n=2 Tax=Caulobacter vibrioides TaxID=155892 RepID=Q9A491_CAUVC|nr:aminotransferase class IV [Caulobacter vibrioides]YP_002518420.1 aminotransferase class IV [Caulobacter vibrioides NA1000]AAK24914.1 4-amino-4-deoxychorismate lyase, putative [Caulobacter vibrioides CB15]ACL96512.1 aminotransferase class IV [Caulobacter vibrioides NA1000]ATC29785.1 4-amino-4-deoxychorismate lyase [Caulobacter vibrioides]QXZ51303.1 aminotransferase class IV [Caulobacter vibrioides]
MTRPDAVPLNDRGLLLGDGLFETMLAQDGAVAHLPAHLDRMAAGCAVLGLPFDREAAQRLVLAAAPSQGRFAIRLTLTAGSGGRGLDRPEAPAVRLFATAAPSTPVTTPATLIVAATRRNEGSPASRLKTLAYLDNVLARAEARAAGADDALMLNNRGEIACAAAANLFWLAGGRLFTPRLDCGVLAGTTRARLLAREAVEEVAVGVEALEAAEAVVLTNSLIGVRPVSRLGERALPEHPLAARLNARLDA